MTVIQKNNICYTRYLYALSAIFLFVIFFKYNLSNSVFGIAGIVLQISITYLFTKTYAKASFQTALTSIILATAFMLSADFYNLLFNHFENNVAFFIGASLRCFTALQLLFLVYMRTYNKKSAPYFSKYFDNYHLFLSIGIILCAGITQHKTELLYAALFLFQLFCGYSVYCMSKKWYLLGNMILALYLATIRLFMFAFYTKEIADTGWAVTYTLDTFAEYFFIHAIFAIATTIILYLYSIFQSKKANKMNHTTAFSYTNQEFEEMQMLMEKENSVKRLLRVAAVAIVTGAYFYYVRGGSLMSRETLMCLYALSALASVCLIISIGYQNAKHNLICSMSVATLFFISHIQGFLSNIAVVDDHPIENIYIFAHTFIGFIYFVIALAVPLFFYIKTESAQHKLKIRSI